MNPKRMDDIDIVDLIWQRFRETYYKLVNADETKIVAPRKKLIAEFRRLYTY